jgi:hypothetical protein
MEQSNKGFKMLTKVKKDVEILDLLNLTNNMKELLLGASWWFEMMGFEFVITSIKSDRENIKTISSTHEEGRAVDIRSRELNEKHIKSFIQFCEDNYSHVGAISAKDNVVRPVVYHNNHFHLQVKREKSFMEKMKFWS